jgi:hypothetical protein
MRRVAQLLVAQNQSSPPGSTFCLFARTHALGIRLADAGYPSRTVAPCSFFLAVEPLVRPSRAHVRAYAHGKQSAGDHAAASSFATNSVVGTPLPSQGAAFP